MNPIVSVALALWTSLIVFVFTEIGEPVTNEFELFDLELRNCNWYLFSKEMRRMLIVLMVNAQKQTVIYGYGNIFCVRQVFRKVLLLAAWL